VLDGTTSGEMVTRGQLSTSIEFRLSVATPTEPLFRFVSYTTRSSWASAARAIDSRTSAKPG